MFGWRIVAMVRASVRNRAETTWLVERSGWTTERRVGSFPAEPRDHLFQDTLPTRMSGFASPLRFEPI